MDNGGIPLMGRAATRNVVLFVVACALSLTACGDGNKHTSSGTTAPAPSQRRPPTSQPSSSSSPTVSIPASRAPSSAPATSSSDAHITVTKTQVPIANGGGAKATIDQPTVVGTDARVTDAIRNAEEDDLAAFGAQLPQLGCVGTSCKGCSAACSTPVFSAQWTSGRADSTIVSGRWTFTTYYPGAAHPYDAYQSVILNARTGDPIDPWALFANNSLTPLSDAVKPLLLNAVNARSGCEVNSSAFAQQAFDDGVAAKPVNYQAVSVVPSGLDVATPPGQLSSEACGGFGVVVPWSAVRSSLSSLGQAVAAGLPLRTAPTIPSSGVAACKDGQVVVSILRTPWTGEAGLSHEGVLLRFAPINKEACTLYGYPGVAGLDANGKQGLQATRTPNGYLGGVQGGKPGTVTITSLSPASALVEGDAASKDGTTCLQLVALLVTPPGLHTSQQIESAPPACGGLQVHPVVPGVTGDA